MSAMTSWDEDNDVDEDDKCPDCELARWNCICVDLERQAMDLQFMAEMEEENE